MSRRRTSFEHEKRRKELERKKKKELKAELRKQKTDPATGLPENPEAVPTDAPEGGAPQPGEPETV